MIDVTVLAIHSPVATENAALQKLMNNRLEEAAASLKATLETELRDEPHSDDLIIYISYNSKYAIRWNIVNDVPEYVSETVARRCAVLGYIVWKDMALYQAKK